MLNTGSEIFEVIIQKKWSKSSNRRMQMIQTINSFFAKKGNEKWEYLTKASRLQLHSAAKDITI